MQSMPTISPLRVVDRAFARLASDMTAPERASVFAHVARIAGGDRFRDARVRLVSVDPSDATGDVRSGVVDATWTDPDGSTRSLLLAVTARTAGDVLTIVSATDAETPLRAAA